MKSIIACLLALLSSLSHGAPFARPLDFSSQWPPGSTYMGVRLLGALELPPVSPSGEKITELSDLTWDEDNRLLYAISDWGALFHFRPVFTEDRLIDLEFIAQYPLRGFDGRPLRGNMADAEGLDAQHTSNTVVDDTELLVSFERIPRLIRFSPQGYPIATVALPTPLQDKQRFRSANKGLEAVVYHPTGQWFIGLEWPPKKAATHMHQIFRADGQAFFSRATRPREAPWWL